jgi:hypothetical protein
MQRGHKKTCSELRLRFTYAEKAAVVFVAKPGLTVHRDTHCNPVILAI